MSTHILCNNHGVQLPVFQLDYFFAVTVVLDQNSFEVETPLKSDVVGTRDTLMDSLPCFLAVQNSFTISRQPAAHITWSESNAVLKTG